MWVLPSRSAPERSIESWTSGAPLRNAPHDRRPKHVCHGQRQFLPNTDGQAEFRVAGPHIADVAVAHIVQPDRRRWLSAPLGLEAIRIAVNRAPPKVELRLAPADRTLEQMPVHDHVCIRRIK